MDHLLSKEYNLSSPPLAGNKGRFCFWSAQGGSETQKVLIALPFGAIATGIHAYFSYHYLVAKGIKNRARGRKKYSQNHCANSFYFPTQKSGRFASPTSAFGDTKRRSYFDPRNREALRKSDGFFRCLPDENSGVSCGNFWVWYLSNN